MMSRSAQSHSSVWSSSGNPAKFVQSNIYRISKKSSGTQIGLPTPNFAVPVVNSLCKISNFSTKYQTLTPTKSRQCKFEETSSESEYKVKNNFPKKSKSQTQGKRELKNKTDDHDDIDSYENENTGMGFHKARTVEEALDIIERRKTSIRAKLLLRKENLLTQAEEQDIHTRADLYAITTVPDPDYYILLENTSKPILPTYSTDEYITDSGVVPPRKKRRRNYGNSDCFVFEHNHEDIFDNTKMLPIGTRLIKPTTKLVELVAQAINGSPDGLLQVQQIYTYLQNKYPFYRYMDRVAINSWRSSIRHALYQKWFRKIRFELSFISSKGCYWAINPKNSPREWTIPMDENSHLDTENNFYREMLVDFEEEEACVMGSRERRKRLSPRINYLKRASEAAAIASKLLLPLEGSIDIPDTDSEDTDDDDHNITHTLASPAVKCNAHHVPSPVREPDPILATCTADWNDEFELSGAESGTGTMTPTPPGNAACLLSQDNDIRTDLTVFTPVRDCINSLSVENCDSPFPGKRLANTAPRGTTGVSPMVSWTPNWEDYGSYILSPYNISTQKLVQGHQTPNFTCTKQDDNAFHLLDVESEGSPVNFCGNESDSGSCDFEIIAEFTKSDLPADLNLTFDTCI